jgi:myo-inositol 2-dehydrogenase/D-chiro-inositol 1-dehydrogenase
MGRIHAETISRSGFANLDYVVDPTGHTADELAGRFGATVVDADTVFADPDVSAIVIASAAPTHTLLIGRAIEAGKGVFCEKPIGLGVHNVRETAKQIDRASLPFQLGFNRRFDPHFVALKARIDADEIGRPELIVLTSRDPQPPPISYIKECGGIIRETTIHDIDVARWLTGEEPNAVYASGAGLTSDAIRAEGELDTVAITLQMPSGAIIVINNSWRVVYGYDQRIEVLGSKGMLSVANRPRNLVSAWSSDGIRKETPDPFFAERYAESYVEEIHCFLRHLASGSMMSPSATDGLKALEVAEAAHESLITKREVRVAYDV